MQRWKVAWEGARKTAKVSCRFHDLRHTFISRLAESQASDSTVMALTGHVSRAMMERYSHIRMEAKRRAVDDLSGTDFEPGVAQIGHLWVHPYSETDLLGTLAVV
jgi:integrase